MVGDGSPVAVAARPSTIVDSVRKKRCATETLEPETPEKDAGLGTSFAGFLTPMEEMVEAAPAAPLKGRRSCPSTCPRSMAPWSDPRWRCACRLVFAVVPPSYCSGTPYRAAMVAANSAAWERDNAEADDDLWRDSSSSSSSSFSAAADAAAQVHWAWLDAAALSLPARSFIAVGKAA